jgi:peptidyl-prolyl cis-trans isomerase A (cyclophilin A)
MEDPLSRRVGRSWQRFVFRIVALCRALPRIGATCHPSRALGHVSLLLVLTCVAPPLLRAEGAAGFDDCLKSARDTRVRLETPLGAVDIQLFGTRSPVSTCNFLRYVQAGRYDGGTFFRSLRPDNQQDKPVQIAVVQADIRDESGERFPPIPLERTSDTGLHHADGTVSMARAGPDTATSSIFVSIGPQPELDFGGKRNPDGQGFAAFGQVICGMNVVRLIWNAPASGERLTSPVPITRAHVIQAKVLRQSANPARPCAR